MVKTQHVDTEVLNEYLKNSDYKIGAIVDALGISRQAFARKRKGEVSFRASEIYVICSMCKIPEDIKPKIFCT